METAYLHQLLHTIIARCKSRIIVTLTNPYKVGKGDLWTKAKEKHSINSSALSSVTLTCIGCHRGCVGKLAAHPKDGFSAFDVSLRCSGWSDRLQMCPQPMILRAAVGSICGI